MAYTVEARDSHGKLIASVMLAPELEALLPRIDEADYPVMRFLDEYGDTTLNIIQVRQLVTELIQLRARAVEPAALSSLNALADVANASQRDPRSELIFIGD